MKQLFTDINNALPTLYATWLKAILDESIPNESKANCMDCVMCKDEVHMGGDDSRRYNPKVKCCSYIPDIPNFMVGRILKDNTSQARIGKKTILKRIRDKNIITPYELKPCASFDLIYDKSRFGFNNSLRCPHFLPNAPGGKQCSIWKNRESTCSTFFCKHVRGSVSDNFWKKIHQLLVKIEYALSEWCVLQLDIGSEALEQLISFYYDDSKESVKGQITDKMPQKLYREIWGKWLGKEITFYKKCADLVNDLNWKGVKKICGQNIELYVHMLKKAYREFHSQELPKKLKIGNFEVNHVASDKLYLSTHREIDGIYIPKNVFDKLHCFDGSITSKVLQILAKDSGEKTAQEILRVLLDYEILIPGDQK